MTEKTLSAGTKQLQTKSGPAPSVQDERNALDRLGQALGPFGLSPQQITNLWVALKSKPALLLSGPRESMRDRLAMDLAKTIAGSQAERCLLLQGHPWWAAKARNQAQFIQAQQRYTTLRLRSFLDFVADPESDADLFFAIMLDVSRAELHEYFVDIPRQVRSIGGVELPFDFALLPTRYSDRLYWLATFDPHPSTWMEPRVLDTATVIELGAVAPLEEAGSAPLLPGEPAFSETLVHSRRFDPRAARAALPAHGHGHDDALRPLRCVLALLRKQRLEPPSGLISDGLLYLGNAWDVAGGGLFSVDPVANTIQAGEFWLKQSALPRLSAMLRQHRALQMDFADWLDDEFPELVPSHEGALSPREERLSI
ncbi:MAG: hypothetical protein ACC647_07785 [Anaerolineales bacterium]